MFNTRFQNPTWETNDREAAGPLSAAEVVECFEAYPWQQEFLARKSKLTAPIFTISDLSDDASLMGFQFGSDEPSFLLFHSRDQVVRFLIVFWRTRSLSKKADNVDLPTANAVVHAFCFEDEESLSDLVPWQQYE